MGGGPSILYNGILTLRVRGTHERSQASLLLLRNLARAFFSLLRESSAEPTSCFGAIELAVIPPSALRYIGVHSKSIRESSRTIVEELRTELLARVCI